MAQEEFSTGIHQVGRRFGKLAPSAEQAVRIRHVPRSNQRFEPLPTPTGAAPYHFDLAQVASAVTMQAIEQAGRLVFHLTGDVGGVKAPQSQQLVAMTMENDFHGDGPAPSFLYIVGDVIDPSVPSLAAVMTNFCASHPAPHRRVGRRRERRHDPTQTTFLRSPRLSPRRLGLPSRPRGPGTAST